MPKAISLLMASICFLMYTNAAWAQLIVDEKHKTTRLVRQHFLLAFVDEHLTIVDNSSSLLLLGARSVITGGNNFLGIVKAYEFMANGNTIVGMAITDRVHSYSGNSMVLMAIGGLAETPDGVNGLTSVGGKSRVGLAVGEVAFVKDDARIGLVAGGVSHLNDRARIGMVLGDVSFISNQAWIGIVVGKISHKAQKDSVFLQIDGGRLLVNGQDLFRKPVTAPNRTDPAVSWPDEFTPHFHDWRTFSF